jgi:hypothetical protein
VKIDIEIPDKTIAYALDGAHSRYWCASMSLTTECLEGYRARTVEVVEYLKDPKHPPRPIDRHTIAAGLALCAKEYPLVFGNLLASNYDGRDGDVLLQCIVFGEVPYG